MDEHQQPKEPLDNIFYDTYGVLLAKHQIYHNPRIAITCMEAVFTNIEDNHLFTIKREIKPLGISITWLADEDLYLVLNLIAYEYIDTTDSGNTCDVQIDAITHTKIDDEMIIKLKSIETKEINIVFTGTDITKLITYRYEQAMIFFIEDLENSKTTQELANKEFIRLGMLEYINIIS